MASDNVTRVIVVHSQALVRDLLGNALRESGVFEVVGQAAQGPEALSLAGETGPDAVVIELDAPVAEGLAACSDITGLLPGVRALMLAASSEERLVLRAMASGATGYLEKRAGIEEFLLTLQDVVRGEIRVPGSVAAALARALRSASYHGPAEPLSLLTGREREILRLCLDGLSYQEIGELKNIKDVTARNTIAIARRKLGFRTRTEMMVWALRAGLLNEPGGQDRVPAP